MESHIFDLSFITSEGLDEDLNPIDPQEHHVSIDVPQEIVKRCAEKYLTIIMQRYMRNPPLDMEYGKVRVLGKIITFK